MNFGFSDEHDAIRDTLARMLSDHATLAVAHDCLEAADGFDSATWTALADGGWLGLAIAEDYGGAAMGAIELAIVAEEIGRSLAAIPFGPVLGLAIPAIQDLGTQSQRENLLPRIAEGRMIVTVALAEDGGSAPERVSAKVLQDRLSGRKSPVSFASDASFAIVAALDEGGTARLYLADLSDPSVSISALDAIDRTRPTSEIVFHDTPVELLPGSDPAAIRTLLDGAAVLAAFEQIGLVLNAVVVSRRFVGKPEPEHIQYQHIVLLGEHGPETVPVPTGGGEPVQQYQGLTLARHAAENGVPLITEPFTALLPPLQRTVLLPGTGCRRTAANHLIHVLFPENMCNLKL